VRKGKLKEEVFVVANKDAEVFLIIRQANWRSLSQANYYF
jgi:hypothetical protein